MAARLSSLPALVWSDVFDALPDAAAHGALRGCSRTTARQFDVYVRWSLPSETHNGRVLPVQVGFSPSGHQQGDLEDAGPATAAAMKCRWTADELRRTTVQFFPVEAHTWFPREPT